MNDTNHDIYPMPLFPRLNVSDVAESTDWYEALGFDVIYSMPVMAHVRYRKYADVMLADESADPAGEGEETGERRGRGVSIYVTVEDETVDDVAERAREFGAEIVEGPNRTPWNTREVTVRDLDGYELVFSEQAESDKSFDEVMGSGVGVPK